MRDGLKRSLEELQKSGKTEDGLCPICFEAEVDVGDDSLVIFQPDDGYRFCNSCTLKAFK